MTAAAGSKGGLLVFGLGPRGLKQLTLETLEAMKSCEELLGAATEPGLAEFCRGLGVPFRDLHWPARPGRPASLAKPVAPPLSRISDDVLARLSAGRRVGLLVDGHPSLFSHARALLQAARERGHDCSSYASLNPLDQMLVALERLVGAQLERGVALYNVLGPWDEPPRPAGDLGAFLYNLGHLFRQEPARFAALHRRLLELYGPAHGVHLLECSPSEDTLRSAALADLPGELDLVGVHATLFVPRVGEGKPANGSRGR